MERANAASKASSSRLLGLASEFSLDCEHGDALQREDRHFPVLLLLCSPRRTPGSARQWKVLSRCPRAPWSPLATVLPQRLLFGHDQSCCFDQSRLCPPRDSQPQVPVGSRNQEDHPLLVPLHLCRQH